MTARRAALALTAAMILGASVGTAAADRDEQERAYTAARRLIAQGSALAGVELDRVIALDPAGPRADDAWIDKARLELSAEWPDELRRDDTARRVKAHLDRVVDEFPGSDRRDEALYLRGLLGLEPGTAEGRDRARRDLLQVATLSSSDWSLKARYALGWYEEQFGGAEEAGDLYTGLWVDAPTSAEAARARFGLGRLDLRAGRFGDAAVAFARAVYEGFAEARPLLELSVRGLVEQAGTSVERFAPRIETRLGEGASALSAHGSDALLVGFRKDGRVVELRRGEIVAEWKLDQVVALASSGERGRFATDGRTLYQLTDDGSVLALVDLTDFGVVIDVAVDRADGFWFLDKRGRRLGHAAAGRRAPVVVWESRDHRLCGIDWDGTQIVAADARSGQRLRFRGGEAEVVGPAEVAKLTAFASDRAGRQAWIDGKSRQLRRQSAVGDLAIEGFDAFPLVRPVALAFSGDGRLRLLDQGGELWELP